MLYISVYDSTPVGVIDIFFKKHRGKFIDKNNKGLYFEKSS